MPATPHDALFKSTFSDPVRAMELMRFVFPPEVWRRIEPGSVTLISGSFVDEALSHAHSDLLFSVRLNGKETFAYLLFEHQSTDDPLMPYRMLQYMAKIWRQWHREHRNDTRLPPILPAVLSHAPGGWKSSVSFGQTYALEPEERAGFGARLLDFKLTVVDLGSRSNEDIKQAVASARTKLTLLSLKNARARQEELLRLIDDWMELFKQAFAAPLGREEVGALWLYLFKVGGFDDTMFGEVIEIMKNANAGEKMEEVATATRKSIWEEALEQGHQEGEQAMLIRMLSHRFGALPADVVERVESASLERLEVLLERGLTASRLDEIFDAD